MDKIPVLWFISIEENFDVSLLLISYENL